MTNVSVTLYCALLKDENLKLLVPRISELHISRLVPIETKRTVNHGYFSDFVNSLIEEERLEVRTDERMEIGEITRFRNAVDMAKGNNLCILLARKGESFDHLLARQGHPTSLSIFLGPEAGWDESEKNFAKEQGFIIIDFGNFSYQETCIDQVNYYIDQLVGSAE